MAETIAYTTAKLVQVVPSLIASQNFLLDRFFGGIVESDTEEVAIDVDVGLRRMSPFVSPLVEGKLVEQGGKKLAVLGQLNALRGSPDDCHPGFLEILGKVQRGLTPELHNGSPWFFSLVDIEYILKGQWFKIQLITGVVIRGDGLRV